MSALDILGVDHVELAVADLNVATELFVDRYGLGVYARSTETPDGVRTVAVGRQGIRLVLTEAGDADHPAAAYVERHGDGVSGIALSTPDAEAAFTEAVRRGARPVAAPTTRDGVVTASIGGFGDVVHTFVQRLPGADERALPGLSVVEEDPVTGGRRSALGLHTVDHFAVCLEAGQLIPTVEFYRTVLGFDMVFTERIVVGRQAMDSMVVQSRSGSVTLTLIEPDLSREPGQIDQFIKDHGGAGVQHIAFATDDIVRDVSRLGANGVGFLRTPGAYYDLVPERLALLRHSVDGLRELNILVDQDQDGQLLQIFTRSVHPRGTLFFEVIERLGARTFGSGNIKALYTAVELEQARNEATR
ncbi:MULTISPECIES: 4-hydroxyphenylpyruvate dioxygenase [Kitasatospora]|uniref:4-hydroxyphenylpyruvate dioxygenase n=1 Tax=Kitasatospora cathayae TaxID=3004092 RepID=A0ABY7Q0G8_9ACTN|nr:4-hydroxyphenylpyruvate dioxygenase [Kitasatospora sp. HUAS 3-15]WBP86168.1 4-hydroxyphenylpyruvate dioxygenase [Kitasatospora sp. HUAS 3-15]